MKIKVYYNRDKHNKPVEAVCLIRHKKNVARGIARCNMDFEHPVKMFGRQLAKGRALECIERKRDLVNKDSGFVMARYNPVLCEMEASMLYGAIPTPPRVYPLVERVRAIDTKAAEFLDTMRDCSMFNLNTDALSCAFTWADTPQGHYYWKDIQERLRDRA